MCGAQQLQCNPGLAPQIIGAHQPIKLVHVHCFESSESHQDGKGGTAVGTAEPHCQNPAAYRDCGFLFNFWVWSREGGTAISLATRLHGICNASHNRMEEGAHLGHLSYLPAPQSWDWG